VNIAVSILSKPPESVDQGLREWSVDLLDDTSPYKMSEKIKIALKSGSIRLPAVTATMEQLENLNHLLVAEFESSQVANSASLKMLNLIEPELRSVSEGRDFNQENLDKFFRGFEVTTKMLQSNREINTEVYRKRLETLSTLRKELNKEMPNHSVDTTPISAPR